MNFLLLYLLMRNRLGRLESSQMTSMLMRIAIPSALLAAICFGGRYLVLNDWPSLPLIPKIVALSITIAAAGAAFFGSAMLFRVAELEAITAGLKRRLMRR
jgi:peptidoglycan biosynthesis protein MviN/MurJ (putative lipid II flippase)